MCRMMIRTFALALFSLSFLVAYTSEIKEKMQDLTDDHQLQSGLAAAMMFTGNMAIAKTIAWRISESLPVAIDSCSCLAENEFVHYRTLLILAGLLNDPMVLMTGSDSGELLVGGLGMIIAYCALIRFFLPPCWLLDSLLITESLPLVILCLSALAYYKSTLQKPTPPENNIHHFYINDS